MQRKYKIIRYYRDEKQPNKILHDLLTLEQAKSHCNREDTRKEGEWFDGYIEVD